MKSVDTLDILHKIYYPLFYELTTMSCDTEAMNTNSVKVQSDKNKAASKDINWLTQEGKMPTKSYCIYLKMGETSLKAVSRVLIFALYHFIQ